jgi:hypothetical protein
VSRIPFWTQETIVAEIQAWVDENGRTPRMLDWRQRGHAPWETTVRRHFGSWSAALEAAGYGRVPHGRRRADW